MKTLRTGETIKLIVLLISCCLASSAAGQQKVSLTLEERSLIQEKVTHDCPEKVFWVPARQDALRCAGRALKAFVFFQQDAVLAVPQALDQPFNILVVIPELRAGYKFIRPERGGIVFDGYVGWLPPRRKEAQEPTPGLYWQRIKKRFPEFFADAALEKWEFLAKFSEPQQVEFGALDTWKQRELERIQDAAVQSIRTIVDERKTVALTIGEFSRWSGYVYVLVPELDTLLTLPFAVSPLGTDYPVDVDSAKRTPLDNANPELVRRIRTHGFDRQASVPQEAP